MCPQFEWVTHATTRLVVLHIAHSFLSFTIPDGTIIPVEETLQPILYSSGASKVVSVCRMLCTGERGKCVYRGHIKSFRRRVPPAPSRIPSFARQTYIDMLRHFCLLAASLVGSAWSNPVLHGLQILEHRDAPPRGFVHGGPASPDTMLNLRLALKQNNMDGLIEALYDVSTPSSAKYGQHLSKYEVCLSSSERTLPAVDEARITG